MRAAVSATVQQQQQQHAAVRAVFGGLPPELVLNEIVPRLMLDDLAQCAAACGPPQPAGGLRLSAAVAMAAALPAAAAAQVAALLTGAPPFTALRALLRWSATCRALRRALLMAPVWQQLYELSRALASGAALRRAFAVPAVPKAVRDMCDAAAARGGVQAPPDGAPRRWPARDWHARAVLCSRLAPAARARTAGLRVKLFPAMPRFAANGKLPFLARHRIADVYVRVGARFAPLAEWLDRAAAVPPPPPPSAVAVVARKTARPARGVALSPQHLLQTAVLLDVYYAHRSTWLDAHAALDRSKSAVVRYMRRHSSAAASDPKRPREDDLDAPPPAKRPRRASTVAPLVWAPPRPDSPATARSPSPDVGRA